MVVLGIVAVVVILVVLAKGRQMEKQEVDGHRNRTNLEQSALYGNELDGELLDDFADDLDQEFASPGRMQEGRGVWEDRRRTVMPGEEDSFRRLMRTGSEEATWFNEADERGWKPEDW